MNSDFAAQTHLNSTQRAVQAVVTNPRLAAWNLAQVARSENYTSMHIVATNVFSEAQRVDTTAAQRFAEYVDNFSKRLGWSPVFA